MTGVIVYWCLTPSTRLLTTWSFLIQCRVAVSNRVVRWIEHSSTLKLLNQNVCATNSSAIWFASIVWHRWTATSSKAFNIFASPTIHIVFLWKHCITRYEFSLEGNAAFSAGRWGGGGWGCLCKHTIIMSNVKVVNGGKGRPFLNSKNSHFHNEGKCKNFLVKRVLLA